MSLMKDDELDHLKEELREANEEIHTLRLDAEEATALHENEIAGLQEEISRLKTEVEREQRVRNEYELEISSLRAEINMKELGTGDSQPSPDVTVVTHYDARAAGSSDSVTRLQEEVQSWRVRYQELKDEYQILQKSNKIAVHQLEKLEAMKYSELPTGRSRSKVDDSMLFESDSEETIERCFSSKRHSLQGGGSVSFKPAEIVGFGSEYNEENLLSQLEEEDEEENVPDFQFDLQCDFQREERNVEALEAQVPVGGMKPAAFFATLAGGLLLFHCLKRHREACLAWLWRAPPML